MSRSEREGGDWNGERILSAGKRAPSLTRIRRKLQEVLRDLAPLERQGKAEEFFNNAENAAQLGGLVEGIHDAMMEYQVCASNSSHPLRLTLLPDLFATRDLRTATGDPQTTTRDLRQDTRY